MKARLTPNIYTHKNGANRVKVRYFTQQNIFYFSLILTHSALLMFEFFKTSTFRATLFCILKYTLRARTRKVYETIVKQTNAAYSKTYFRVHRCFASRDWSTPRTAPPVEATERSPIKQTTTVDGVVPRR